MYLQIIYLYFNFYIFIIANLFDLIKCSIILFANSGINWINNILIQKGNVRLQYFTLRRNSGGTPPGSLATIRIASCHCWNPDESGFWHPGVSGRHCDDFWCEEEEQGEGSEGAAETRVLLIGGSMLNRIFVSWPEFLNNNNKKKKLSSEKWLKKSQFSQYCEINTSNIMLRNVT